jgi:electron transfer flavoprotein alpha subunit
VTAQDILVVADSHRGVLSDITFEMLGGARQLATETGGRVCAVVIAKEAEQLGQQLATADRTIAFAVDGITDFDPETTLANLLPLVDELQPRAVLIGSTSTGLDLAPVLAARRNWPILSGCKAVAAAGEQLRVTLSLCGGKLSADVPVDTSPVVLLVSPGSFAPVAAGGDGPVEVRAASAVGQAIELQQILAPAEGDVDITKESLLLGVGRGIQQEDNLELAEELAEALGGQLCASRPVIDQGWLPATRQIGKSGMTVKPKCYFALGISGAPEHVEGMVDSELIVAVNTDVEAPIFEVAHYGVVGDLLDVVPAITQAIKDRTAK